MDEPKRYARLAQRVIAGLSAVAMMACGGNDDDPAPSSTTGRGDYAVSSDAKVTVTGGQIQGLTLPTGVSAFYGVPYMASPVGSLRWAAPRPVVAWTGTLATRTFPPVAQFSSKTSLTLDGTDIVLPMNEDGARYMNIWVPPAAMASAGKLPVLVWIHGNNSNASQYRYAGDKLAAKGLIVVNLQYRQGVFANLALAELSAETGNNNSSGNLSTLDQIAALTWVKNNIASFGGDPDNVSLGGHSSGSAYSTMLQASPLAKGLFNKVWTQAGFWFEGTNADTGATLAAAQAAGAAWRAAFGTVAGTATAASVADLRAKPAAEIMRVPAVPVAGAKPGPVQGIVDNYVFPDTVTNLFRAGKQSDVPVWAEWASAEGGALPVATVTSLATYQTALSTVFGANQATVFGFYSAFNDADAIAKAQAVATDASNAMQNTAYARLQQIAGKSAVYLSRFDRGNVAGQGAKHGWENAYWRGRLDAAYSNLTYPNATAADYALSDSMMDSLIAWCKTGNPNTATVTVPAYNRSSEQFTIFDVGAVAPVPMNPGVDWFIDHVTELATYQ